MTNKAKINTIETAAKIVFTLCAVLAVFAVCSITIYMVAKGTPAFANVGVSELYSERFGNRLHRMPLTEFYTSSCPPLWEPGPVY